MDWQLFFIFLMATGAAASTGMIFQPGAWYAALDKPTWTPKAWVFPVVWTTLYILMAYAAARVATHAEGGQALAFWALQIALNTLWTPVFFGKHKIRIGLIVIIALWLAVLGTLIAMWQVDVIASLVFVPYLIWVSIATALNFTIWRMNPDPVEI